MPKAMKVKKVCSVCIALAGLRAAEASNRIKQRDAARRKERREEKKVGVDLHRNLSRKGKKKKEEEEKKEEKKKGGEKKEEDEK